MPLATHEGLRGLDRPLCLEGPSLLESEHVGA
jgi:hypothetical protein